MVNISLVPPPSRVQTGSDTLQPRNSPKSVSQCITILTANSSIEACSLSKREHPEKNIPITPIHTHLFNSQEPEVTPSPAWFCVKSRFLRVGGKVSNCRHKNTKVQFVWCVSKFVPQGTLWNKVPCADTSVCVVYVDVSNPFFFVCLFPVHQVSKIFYKQTRCSNILIMVVIGVLWTKMDNTNCFFVVRGYFFKSQQNRYGREQCITLF